MGRGEEGNHLAGWVVVGGEAGVVVLKKMVQERAHLKKCLFGL